MIDVDRRFSVETRQARLAAFSYVWGEKSSLRPSLLRATRASLQDMMKEGGLAASDMP